MWTLFHNSFKLQIGKVEKKTINKAARWPVYVFDQQTKKSFI